MSQQPQLITYSFNNHQIVAGHAVQANVVMAHHQGSPGALLHQPTNLVRVLRATCDASRVRRLTVSLPIPIPLTSRCFFRS